LFGVERFAIAEQFVLQRLRHAIERRADHVGFIAFEGR
jgi:hypothetical protein